MRRVYRSLFVAISSALLCVSAVAEPTPSLTTGIEGTIVVSPIHGGPIRKGEEPSVAPVRQAQFVVKSNDTVIATFTTDDAGCFRVALPPGHYVVVRDGAPPAIGSWQFAANVVEGQMTKVDWTADSGMR